MTRTSEFEDLLNRHSHSLRRAGPVWLQLIGGQPDPTWQPSQDLQKRLSDSLRILHRKKEAPEDVGRSCRQITRGIYLVRAALEWETPSVGNKGPTSLIRGEQWRVAMAWAGFEVLAKATVCGASERGLTADDLDHACQFAVDDLPTRLAPPSARLKKLQEARNWPSSTDRPAMLDYLGVGKGYATEMLKRWLVEGKTLKRPADLLGCAQAIRHATAHGALSSSGVRSWGMQPALLPLTVAIAGVSCGLITQICKDV